MTDDLREQPEDTPEEAPQTPSRRFLETAERDVVRRGQERSVYRGSTTQVLQQVGRKFAAKRLSAVWALILPLLGSGGTMAVMGTASGGAGGQSVAPAPPVLSDQPDDECLEALDRCERYLRRCEAEEAP